MASWLGLRRRGRQGKPTTPAEQQPQQPQQQHEQEEEFNEAETPAGPSSSFVGHLAWSLLRWLLALASVWGVLCAALAVAVGLADRHALRMGKHPTWPTYRVGLRVLEAIEWARDTMTPPDLRALEMTYAVFDTAIVASLGALDAFPKGAEDDAAVCLRSEEIAMAAPVATHAPEYLYRLLRAAATRGLLGWHPDRDDCFTLTALGVRFQRGSPFYPQALWHDDETVRVFFGGLHTALRTGQLPFSAAHNTNATLWEYLQLHPCRRALFDATLARVTEAAAPMLAEAVDEAVAAADAHQAAKLSSSSLPTTTALARPGKYVCDVGGGGGGGVGMSPLLSAVLARHPGARGLVYDLAEAARDDTLPAELELDEADVAAQEAAAEAAVVLTGAGGGGGGVSALLHNLWPGLAKRGTSLADARRRIKRVSGFFLDRDETMAKLGGGRCDLFLLKHVLHDWSDEASVAILSNLREAMLSAPYGERPPRLVVLEQVVGGVREGQGPGACNASSGHHGRQGRFPNPVTIYDRMAAAMDVNMACMVGEGRERSEAEWRAVFATAGFRLVYAAPTKSPMFVMLLEPCEKH